MQTQMEFKTRDFYSDELRVLKTLKVQIEKRGSNKAKFYHFVLAIFLGAIFVYLATLTPDGFLLFLFGTIAVLLFGFVVFMPYEIYKAQRWYKKKIQCLNALIEKGTISTCRINATRIALAKEYEDENDWYIVELCKDKVLYLWDSAYNLNKKFPCLVFEIYENNFFELTGKQIYPLSEKIKPVMIAPKKKWEYMKQIDMPDHCEEQLVGAPESTRTAKISFDELINKIEKN